MPEISSEALATLRGRLSPLVGIPFELLRLPKDALAGFEPSQIGSMIGVLLDACIPQLNLILPENELLAKVGLTKHAGILGEREGYPDFLHSSGIRLELKLLYIDPVGVTMKKPPTRREASARLTQKVTVKNVNPSTDALLVIAYQLKPTNGAPELYSPTIVDLEVFSMIECIRARDHRLSKTGRWMGDYETPVILSASGKAKRIRGEACNETVYGRKANEGHDYNEDTNFGKLKRIPYEPLQRFLKKHNAGYMAAGTYPAPWIIRDAGTPTPLLSLADIERIEAGSDSE